MTNHDVVKKLIGAISPVGETNTDEQRFENLKEMCHLAEMIIMDISDMVHRNKDCYEYSIKKCAEYGVKFLKENIQPLIPEQTMQK